jgi:hypothetical protein
VRNAFCLKTLALFYRRVRSNHPLLYNRRLVADVLFVFQTILNPFYKYAFDEACISLFDIMACDIISEKSFEINDFLWVAFPTVSFKDIFLADLLNAVQTHEFPIFRELLLQFFVTVRQVSRLDPDFNREFITETEFQ